MNNSRPNLMNWAILAAMAAVIGLPVPLQAQYELKTVGGLTTITRYSGPGGALAIPASIDGRPVQAIGASAFESASLTDVTLPNSVVAIGPEAFVNCATLATVTLGSKVEYISEDAFATCVRLTNITVDPANPVYTSHDGVLFDQKQNQLLVYPSGKAGGYEVPDGVASIAWTAFRNCLGLTSVIVPDSVTELGRFDGCRALTNAVLGNGAAYLPWRAFSGCKALTAIVIPDSMISISPEAFRGCTALETVVIGRGVTNLESCGDFYGSPLCLSFDQCPHLADILVAPANTAFASVDGVLFNKAQNKLLFYPRGKNGTYAVPPGVTTIGTRAFKECVGLSQASLPPGLTSIEFEAFKGCVGLSEAGLPPTVKTIQDSAFSGCTGLQSLLLAPGVDDIQKAAFSECISLRTLTIPDSVTQLGEGAFSGCTGLTNVVVGSGLTLVAPATFQGCSALQTLTLPRGLKEIGNSAFSECATLPAVSIPEGVTRLGDFAFFDCSNLENVTIPDSVTSIGEMAFRLCTRLPSVLISENVASIGPEAFLEATSLTNIQVHPLNLLYASRDGVLYNKSQKTLLACPGGKRDYAVPEGVTGIASFAFFGCKNLISVSLPDSLVGINTVAFSGCTTLTTIRFPEKLAAIGDQAFWWCTALKAVTIPAQVTGIGAQAFGLCSSLVNISVDPANQAYRSIDGVLFDRSQKTLLTYPAGKVGEYRIPETVTAITREAFLQCTGLSKVEIPASVTKIGDYSFGGCSHLTEISVHPLNSLYKSIDGVLFNQSGILLVYPKAKPGPYIVPESVSLIAEEAFNGCLALTSLSFPSRVATLSQSHFLGCSALTNITIDPLNRNYSSRRGVVFNKDQTVLLIYPSAARGEYVVPGQVTTIQWEAFFQCTGLTGLVLPNSLTNIGADAFYGCTALMSLTIPPSVATIEDLAFESTALQRLYFTGDVPERASRIFDSNSTTTIYCRPGTAGWGPFFAGRPAVLWNPQIRPADASFGVRAGEFGFNIEAENIPFLVEASDHLDSGPWTPVPTITLSNGFVSFRDPEWKNHLSRYFRIRSR